MTCPLLRAQIFCGRFSVRFRVTIELLFAGLPLKRGCVDEYRVVSLGSLSVVSELIFEDVPVDCDPSESRFRKDLLSLKSELSRFCNLGCLRAVENEPGVTEVFTIFWLLLRSVLMERMRKLLPVLSIVRFSAVLVSTSEET